MPQSPKQFELVIDIPKRPRAVGRLVPGVYRLGSSPASHIQIELPEVSARHAVLTVHKNEVSLEDCGSTNGTFLNGTAVQKRKNLSNGDIIQIGAAKLTLREIGAAQPVPEAPKAEPTKQKIEPISPSISTKPTLTPTAPKPIREPIDLLKVSGVPLTHRPVIQKFKQLIHEELIKRVNLRKLTLSGADSDQVMQQTRDTVKTILEELQSRTPSGINLATVEKEVLNEAVGLGPLEDLLEDDTITEVMVNGAEHIYVERAGVLYRTDLMFADNSQLVTVIERIVAPLGRRIDESQPLVDARLQDGSRVNAVIPPLAIDGPSLTIRKFGKEIMTIERLIGFGSLTKQMADFLRLCVLARKNIIISGGTGSGKTTMLNTLSNFLPDNERIITIEDAAELKLQKQHVVRMEARPPNIEGRGEIAIRDLVRNSLRMRPDRIVVGECRGGEALDMLQAMNTGHDGSLTTIHANTSRDALVRLETLVLMAGFDLPLRAIREQIASAVSIVVQVNRFKDGTRKVEEISEITGMEGDIITSQEIFRFKSKGLSDEGKILGAHGGCGIVPTFIDEINALGLSVDLSIFNQPEEC